MTGIGTRRYSVRPEQTAPARPKVLVVDDDPDLRTLAEIQLSDGFEVLQAPDGPSCVALATAHEPDVILLDVMMPGMDGNEVLSHLTSDPVTRDIPVIFLSALGATEDKVRALTGGAVDYIAKPADPREFVARVGAAARTKARQIELKNSQADDMTGLEGLRQFRVRLDQEVSRARRKNAPLAILLLDVDSMQEARSQNGGGVGDALRRAAETITKTLRNSDILYRAGDNRFAAILPETESGTAFLAAERCREAIRRSDLDGEMTVSVGLAELSPGRGAAELVEKAGAALAKAKDSGGSQTWRADDPRRRSLNPIALAEELTDREWVILSNLAEHRTEQDIARRMGIQPGTVRSHKARIRRKLHVPSDRRLSDFVRQNYSDLLARIAPIVGE